MSADQKNMQTNPDQLEESHACFAGLPQGHVD
jgi:hypothetical protein